MQVIQDTSMVFWGLFETAEDNNAVGLRLPKGALD